MPKFDLAHITGLSEQEARRRLEAEGFNELPSAKPRSLLSLAFSVVREPMFLLLVGGGIIYLILGDVREALMLMAFVVVIIGITFYQERKTERALEALRDLSSPRAMVIRDGHEKRIAGREVVRGDVLVLSEGDRVPADGDLLSDTYIEVDESLVTGESLPVRKTRRNGDAKLYSGTLVVRGKAVAEVRAVGLETVLGQIGKRLQTVEREETRLHRETGRMVRTLAAGGFLLCAAVVIIYGTTRHNWLEGFLVGITMAMAIMPEEFPVVLSIFLAVGAWRISQKNVLTRRMPAVETLGAATVLCVDKTGTLTQNKMSVNKLFARDGFFDVDYAIEGPLPEPFHEILEYSILASHKDPFDPMEKAFQALGDRYLANTEHLHDDWVLQQEYPLSQDLLAMSHVWRSPDARDYVIAAKGAPEAIADLCHFNETRLREINEHVTVMAREGLRVLAVAKALFFVEAPLPDAEQATVREAQHDFDFQFLGLIGLADPLRPTVPAAIQQCYRAGMRVVMITGDYAETALNIARQIGLTPSDKAITGPELDAMDDAQLRERVRATSVYARVVPEQKLRLVNALKANGEVVAMTGDGVNDAPALKAAHIGIAMGGRGTDVARESADLVLVDDDFSSIVEAVKLGRRVFDNLKKAIAYILAIHVPIAGLSFIPVLFKWPLVLMPMHIVFLELVIDPACSVAFEAEDAEPDAMERPPRPPDQPLFSPRLLLLSLMQGLAVLAIVLVVFVMQWYRGFGEKEARTLTFATLIVANLSLILTNRSWSRTIAGMFRVRNRALWLVVILALVFLSVVIYVPFLRDLFHFTVLHPVDFAIALAAGFAGIAWFEGLKVLRRKLGRREGI
ncbi:MAG TPA: cation-translocating P-type ATPase [Candidatus Bathyarchaeia archaeon]|nr:cation-translocating P-type ATPase [Candidatus Bathyarchaeia archaeon]